MGDDDSYEQHFVVIPESVVFIASYKGNNSDDEMNRNQKNQVSDIGESMRELIF
jgi:hypothetical protein